MELLNQIRTFDNYLDKEISNYLTHSEKRRFKECLQLQSYSILKNNKVYRQKNFIFITPYRQLKGKF